MIGVALGTSSIQVIAGQLGELREQLFVHFAREEEGLFPFVAEMIPELAERVQLMVTAHDTICGALARMCHASAASAPRSELAAMFERFQVAYGEHAGTEAALLRSVGARLDDEQRERLAVIVRGL